VDLETAETAQTPDSPEWRSSCIRPNTTSSNPGILTCTVCGVGKPHTHNTCCALQRAARPVHAPAPRTARAAAHVLRTTCVVVARCPHLPASTHDLLHQLMWLYRHIHQTAEPAETAETAETAESAETARHRPIHQVETPHLLYDTGIGRRSRLHKVHKPLNRPNATRALHVYTG
jgi:hypothetical protein